MNGVELRRQRDVINRFRQEIVLDLDVQHVLPDLLADLVVTYDDKQRVDNEATAVDKADRLVTILLSKDNPNAIPAFTKALKKKYYWLFTKLTQDEVDLPKCHTDNNNSSTSFVDMVKENDPFDSPKHHKFKNLLETGGVQCLPAVAVERKILLEQIRNELKTMKQNQYLVIQGMAGSGKSVLAAHAVHCEDLVSTYFQDGVFWLVVGKECSESKDALLAKMRILCDKLGESRAPNSLEHGAELLRIAFSAKPQTLLVLDDVWRPEVIRAFDLKVPILVTTRDVSNMDVVNGRYKVIKVEEGFTEAESLELFCQALNISCPADLPSEAIKIHNESKGSPMVISLISALLQEHSSTLYDEGRWKYYLESLCKRKYSKMRRSHGYEHQSVIDAIALSVENLNAVNKRYYSDFALFQDDIGIPCPVLMVLWGLQKYEVEDIMKDFVRKSLAVDDYDPQKKHYIYMIHDLQLDYVKYQMLTAENRERELHQKLLYSYHSKCNGEFHKLPDDGYIFFHLGYHIYKSKLHHYFAKLYLDLQFIGEKMRITGPADLLVDLRKYLDFIVCGDEEKLKFVEEVQTFAQLVGHRIYGQIDLDVIQIALQTPHLRRVYDQARILALIANKRLYIEWKNANSGQWKLPESTVLVSDHVHSVKFVGDRGNHFIAALSDGTIQLCDLESSAVCYTFFGHTDTVNSLSVFESHSVRSSVRQNGKAPPKKIIFLSASADKSCKLWDLKPILEEVESKSQELKSGRLLGTSPSPKLRPDQWAFDQTKDDSYLTFGFHTAVVSYAEFSIDGSRVVSTSLNEIMIWDSSNGQILSKISPAFPNLTFQACHFSPENLSSYLLCSAENQVVLLSPERSSLYASVEGHPMNIVQLLFISATGFCTVSENEIGIWKVIKIPNKPKAIRSRSLSPRVFQPDNFANGLCNASIEITEVDSRPLKEPELKFGTPKFGNFLNPNVDMQGDWNWNPDSDSVEALNTGRKPSATKSDCFPSLVTTKIDNESCTIQVVREEVFTRTRASGLFLSAATTFMNKGKEQLLACGTSDHKIVLWKLHERTFLGEFSSHNGWVTCLDFSAVDHCTLLSGSEDHTVMIWDLENEEKGFKEPQKNAVFSSVYVRMPSPPGFFVSLFSTDKNTIQVYRDYRRLGETDPLSSEIGVVCLSECANKGAIGTCDGRIFCIREVPLDRTNIKIPYDHIGTHDSEVKCIRFSQSGNVVVSGSSSGEYKIFQNFMLLETFNGSSAPILQFYFPHPYSSTFIVCSQNAKIQIVNTDTFRIVRTWESDAKVRVNCIDFNSESSMMALGTSEDGVLLLYLTEFSIANQFLPMHYKSPIRTVAFNHDGTKLAIGNDNGLIKIWSLTNQPYREETDLLLHKSWVRNIIFSPSSCGEKNWLVSCGDKLAFWSLEKPEERIRTTSFMAERRRRRSGESGKSPCVRLSLEIPEGNKIGRQGKRELLQQFAFRGNFAQRIVCNPSFSKFMTVDDTGIFYFLEVMKSGA